MPSQCMRASLRESSWQQPPLHSLCEYDHTLPLFMCSALLFMMPSFGPGDKHMHIPSCERPSPARKCSERCFRGCIGCGLDSVPEWQGDSRETPSLRSAHAMYFNHMCVPWPPCRYGTCDILKHMCKELQAPLFNPVSQVGASASEVQQQLPLPTMLIALAGGMRGTWHGPTDGMQGTLATSPGLAKDLCLLGTCGRYGQSGLCSAPHHQGHAHTPLCRPLRGAWPTTPSHTCWAWTSASTWTGAPAGCPVFWRGVGGAWHFHCVSCMPACTTMHAVWGQAAHASG